MENIKKNSSELKRKKEKVSITNAFSSCCCDNGHSHQQKKDKESKTMYRCRMKCEGDKTYDAPGNCPVCNMQLAPVKN